jgi:hypothetical protein
MVHQEILDKKNELFEINGDASKVGGIKEIINKSKTLLPWLHRNRYNYYMRPLQGAPDTIMTNNDDQSTSKVYCLTSPASRAGGIQSVRYRKQR